MALRDRDVTPSPLGRRRRIDEILDVLDDDDTAVLLRWLNDPNIPSRTIARELTAEGHPVAQNAVTAYRRDVLGVER